MQKYKRKKPLASFADRLLRVMLACGLGIGWFVYLWGLSLPALCAGVGLGGLLWLCVRQFSKQSTMKQEKQMRRIIGGELAVNQLLLQNAKHAGFLSALWIAPRFPISMHKAVDWGVIGTLNDKQTMVRLIAQHASMPIDVQQMVEVVREVHARKMEACILCVTAPLSKDANAFLLETELPFTVISREELIELAGLCSPATDEQLSKLGRRKQKHRSRGEWLDLILPPSKARRYFWYGMGMSGLALATGNVFYPLPAAVCLMMYLLCKLRGVRKRPRSA